MEQYELYGLNVVGVANFVHRRVSQMIDLWLQILCFLFVFCKLVDATAELLFPKKKKKDATSMGACTANPSADSL
jgi:hypothetical protein